MLVAEKSRQLKQAKLEFHILKLDLYLAASSEARSEWLTLTQDQKDKYNNLAEGNSLVHK